jgi:hypothetical protein
MQTFYDSVVVPPSTSFKVQLQVREQLSYITKTAGLGGGTFLGLPVGV